MAPNYGYIEDKFDANDKPYYYCGTKTARSEFQSANLIDDLPSKYIYNQEDTSSCVANATCMAIRYLATKTTNSKIPMDPARLYIYYNARAVAEMEKVGKVTEWPENVVDMGTRIRDAMKAINAFGIAGNDDDRWIHDGPEENPFPIDVNSRPHHTAYKDAQSVHAVEYCRLDPDHTPVAESILEDEEKDAIGIVTLARLKQCLVEGLPVIFGFSFFWPNFTTIPSLDPKEADDKKYPTIAPIPLERKHIGPPPGTKYGAHAVLAVGFDNQKKRVLIQNSWGAARNPYFWMPYDWITDFEATNDFWVVRTIGSSGPPPRREITRPTEVGLPANGKWSLTTSVPDNGDVAMAATSAVASACRHQDMAELFWISSRGAIEHAWYITGSPWKHIRQAGEGTAAIGSIAALSRNENTAEIFWIAPDGSVRASHAIGEVWNPWTVSEPGTAIPGAGIAALTRSPDHMEVWWVGPGGSINLRWFTEGVGWQVRYELAPKGSASLSSAVTALAIDNNEMAVWWITQGGTIDGRHWKNDGGWTDLYPADMLGKNTAALRTRIGAVARGKNAMEVFYITPRGGVAHQTWTRGAGWVEKNFRAAYSARVDSGITVVSTHESRMDVFWIGPNNSLLGSTWQNGLDWQHNIVAPSGRVMAGTPMGYFKRYPNSFSLCFLDYDGGLVLGNYDV